MGTYPCPCDIIAGDTDCGRSFGTENGAVMHALNKSDGYHATVDTKPTAYEALAEDSALDRSPDPVAEAEETAAEEAANAASEPAGGLTATMPGAAESQESNESTGATCPECGTGLGMSEADAEEYVRENGGAWCDSCGHKLVVR